MKVILRSDMDNLGRLGEMVNVRPGYARNYLVPKGLAMEATASNLNAFEQERRKLQSKMDAVRTDAEQVAEKLAATEVVLSVRVGENEKLYGSVTSGHIADALAEQGIVVDKKKIVLESPIRALGAFDVEVKLHPDVQTTLKVIVKRHDREEHPEENAEEE
mgnify:CR=1 FL=1